MCQYTKPTVLCGLLPHLRSLLFSVFEGGAVVVIGLLNRPTSSDRGCRVSKWSPLTAYFFPGLVVRTCKVSLVVSLDFTLLVCVSVVFLEYPLVLYEGFGRYGALLAESSGTMSPEEPGLSLAVVREEGRRGFVSAVPFRRSLYAVFRGLADEDILAVHRGATLEFKVRVFRIIRGLHNCLVPKERDGGTDLTCLRDRLIDRQPFLLGS